MNIANDIRSRTVHVRGVISRCSASLTIIKDWTFQTFIEAYEQLIESLRRSADNYERAEDANKRNVGGVGGGAYR